MLIRVILIALLPVIAIAVLDKSKNNIDKLMSKLTKQIICGLFFGIFAIISSECGLVVDGVAINSRDAAPIIAGLFIGGPAGVIAGVLAAIDRVLSVNWGADTYTLVADSLSVVLAGLIATFLRKMMFEDKSPNWFMSLFNGIVIETMHLFIILVTNIYYPERVIDIAYKGTVPMILITGASVMLTSLVLLVSSPHKKLKRRSNENKSIFETIQDWLLNVIMVAFITVSVLMIFLESNLAKSQIDEQFRLAMDEVSQSVSDASDAYQIKLTKMIANEVKSGDYDLEELTGWYNVSEINVVNRLGIIVETSNPAYLGFDMSSGEQSAEFLCLLDRSTEFAQSYRPVSADGDVYMKYAGVAIDSGFVQTGYNAENFQSELNKEIRTALKNRHVGRTGFFIVLDENNKVVTTSSNMDKDEHFSVSKFDFSNISPNKLEKIDVNGTQYYCYSNTTEGYVIMAVCAVDDAMMTGIISIYIAFFNMVLVFAVIFILVYILIKKLVVNQIVSMANSLGRISEGNLDEVVDVRSNAEFASLSDDINTTVDTLKRYIAEAASRIDKELEFAKNIQHSAMPSHFPAFPNRNEFDIYARMDTAKEVGGDFYDFYFTDVNQLNFMIADVSGKGIPAAMFMMRAKSVLRGQAGLGHEINEVFEETNNMLCEDNEANMFVTAWQGSIDLTSGKICIANAGHNPALIRHKGGEFEYLRLKPNLVLASMEEVPYRKHELDLQPGDIIYLYTDGVTEATNINNELYGEDRLINLLNSNTDRTVREICDAVKEDVDLFVGEAPQFDDITMVAFEYFG